ncbi:MAG: 30S ribosomal protein S9 [Deltaproteobacteria bacterium]|nr:MAG: 30S ribosomal protein S9 [Deltaproteobacteria bacterium]
MAKSKMRYYATGRRKSAVARVWLLEGDGNITINRRDASEYLRRKTNLQVVEQPLQAVGGSDKFDVWCTVRGGGLSGQAGAIRLGIARALLRVDEGHREPLKRAGFLTRDAREKERKKYGRKGARARFQFSKR